jgi:PleD family two-component response regulator
VESEAWCTLAPELRVTMSVGLAFCDADAEASALLANADSCLYRAKRLGRNRVVAVAVRRAGSV